METHNIVLNVYTLRNMTVTYAKNFSKHHKVHVILNGIVRELTIRKAISKMKIQKQFYRVIKKTFTTSDGIICVASSDIFVEVTVVVVVIVAVVVVVVVIVVVGSDARYNGSVAEGKND